MTPRKPHPGRPPRLDVIHQRYSEPLWYLTLALTTWNREPWLATSSIRAATIAFANEGISSRRAFLGRYVLMPHHVHLFLQLDRNTCVGN
jgi:hypothetical protein